MLQTSVCGRCTLSGADCPEDFIHPQMTDMGHCVTFRAPIGRNLTINDTGKLL